MPRYRALIEYDGTAYAGFQRQLVQQTVQGKLENALYAVVHQPVTIGSAGRTDTGVHALGQVISFKIDWRHGVEKLQRAINVNLPKDIVILQLDEAKPDFHPRYDARRRAYEYHIYNTAVRSPIRRHYSWHVRQPLAIDKMNQAAMTLIGVQDFATFGQPPQGNITTRELFAAEWRMDGALLVFFVQANAFLYRMVRSIVGSLVAVGKGEWTVAQFVDALQARDRGRSAAVAPAHGLYLVDVTYEDDEK